MTKRQTMPAQGQNYCEKTKYLGTWKGRKYVKDVCSRRVVYDYDLGGRLVVHVGRGRPNPATYGERLTVEQFMEWARRVRALRQ